MCLSAEMLSSCIEECTKGLLHSTLKRAAVMYLGAQRHLHSVCKALHAGKHPSSTFDSKFYIFGRESTSCLIL